MKTPKLLLIICIVLMLASCSKEPVKVEVKTGTVALKLLHTIDGNVFQKDVLLYQNRAGNQYQVSNIQWFLSDIELVNSDGIVVKIVKGDGVFYIDTDLHETCSVLLEDLPAGNYNAVKFTFGLNEEKNTSYRFVNPPESFMFWPDYLGGGYHYMKLNGKWMNTMGQLAPYNFHLGIGQNYYQKSSGLAHYFEFGSADSYAHCEGFNPPYTLPDVSSFVQNYFEVSQDLDFSIVSGSESSINVEMQIEKWFEGNPPYNHDDWGGSIMQQQQAQDIARINGQKVFRFSNENQ
jgi:hypothetical protein